MQATDAPKLQPVHLYEGVAFLRIRGLPSPAAALTAYTAEGCTCRLAPGDIDPAHEPQWRQRLQNGGSVELDMSAPPFLPGVHLKAKVQHARIDPENRLELQLTFVDLEGDERETLMSAVNSVFSAGTSDSSEESSDRPQTAADRVAPTSGVYDSGVFRAVSKPGGKKGSNLLAAVNPDADSYRGRKLGEILIKTGQLTELQAEAATTQSRANNEKLGRYLLRTGLLTSTELCRALSYQSGLPMVDLSTTTTLPRELTSLFSYLHMLRYEYVPYDCTHDTVSVATLQPMPRNIVNEIASRCKKQVQLFLGEDDQIIRLLYTMQPQKDRKMRKAPRFSLKVPIAMRLFDQDHSTLDDAVHYGKTIDLSEAGMMIATQYPAAINSSLHVSFTFAPHHIEALSTVRHVAAAAGADSEYKWQIGISFTELTQEARSSLGKACARLRVWNIADHRRE